MKWNLRTVGLVIIGGVGLVLLLAGILKLVNFGADDMLEGLQKARLAQHQTLISITAILCGSLLLIPITRKIGYLMASAYWGGAMVAHLSYDDSVAMPATFMAILCIGVLLTEWRTSSTATSSASNAPDA